MIAEYRADVRFPTVQIMNKAEKKVKKVMREFKKGKLPIGKSDKKVKNRKQAIAIALSEAGLSRRRNAKRG